MKVIVLSGISVILACTLNVAYAQGTPNGSYSAFSLSYRNTTLSTPICVANECHSALAGPSMLYAYQLMPNLVLGAALSSVQSTGSSSTLKSTSNSFFIESVAGLGSYADVGVLLAPLATSLQACSTLIPSCTVTNDSGIDIGVFGKVFLDETQRNSIELSYDSVSYQRSATQTFIIGLSLVTVLGDHHRFSLAAEQIQDSNGNNTSNNLGYGYSYLF